MTDLEIAKVTAPIKSVCSVLQYDETVVIGSVVGQLVTEIKRLREVNGHI